MRRILLRSSLLLVASGLPPLLSLAGDSQEAVALFKQLDVNQDGQLSSDEARGEKERLFKRLVRTSDKDGNGQLSVDEFSAGLSGNPPAAEAPQATPDQAGLPEPANRPEKAGRPGGPGAMFKRLDANSDGKIERDELPEKRRPMFGRMLERADQNGDGALDREEFAKLGPPPGAPMMRPMAGAMRLVAALDTDGDGELSSQEIAAAEASLKTLDRNGDGKISRPELTGAGPAQAATEAAPTTAPDDVDQLVQRALKNDQNGDSRLSPEEAPKNLQKAFAKVDTNSDGQLDAEELKARFASAQKKQRAKPDKSRKSDKPAN